MRLLHGLSALPRRGHILHVCAFFRAVRYVLVQKRGVSSAEDPRSGSTRQLIQADGARRSSSHTSPPPTLTVDSFLKPRWEFFCPVL